MFELRQNYLVVPGILHAILLYGGGLVALLSISASVWGAFKKKPRKYFIKWAIVFLVSLLLMFLTTRYGVIVGDYMLGG